MDKTSLIIAVINMLLNITIIILVIKNRNLSKKMLNNQKTITELLNKRHL